MFKLFVCLLVLASATVAAAAPMPWTTFSGEMAAAAINANMIQCPRVGGLESVEVFIAKFVFETDGYLMVYNTDSHLIMFAYYPKREKPTEIGFGVVDVVNAHDTIPPLTWRAVTPADNRSFCEMIMPAQA